MSEESKQLLTVYEAEALTGRKAATWRRDIWRRQIPYVKLGRLVRIPREVLEDLIRNGYHEAAKEATMTMKREETEGTGRTGVWECGLCREMEPPNTLPGHEVRGEVQCPLPDGMSSWWFGPLCRTCRSQLYAAMSVVVLKRRPPAPGVEMNPGTEIQVKRQEENP